MFTTRPELIGRHGVVASTHWLATQAGMNIFAAGGNAADAAVAAGFAQQVLEPHMCGPGGDMPAIVRDAAGEVSVVCGQGVAPRAATIGHMRALGLGSIPGTGLLPAVVPGAFGAWLLLAERWGRLRLADLLAPAISLARGGFPVSPGLAAAIATVAPTLRDHWPTSAAVWTRRGEPPAAGARWTLPALADTYERVLRHAVGDGGRSREAEMEAARAAWYEGFVADAIGAFCAGTDVWDGTHAPHRGLLAADDLAAWRATVERPASARYHGWQVYKTGPWGQGPVMLQQLTLLQGFALGDMDPLGAQWTHTVVECAKLAMADREAWYGDPAFADVPLDALLSAAYANERRTLVGDSASGALVPGAPDGRAPRLPDFPVIEGDRDFGYLGGGEPTMQTWPSGRTRGDTCHIDAIDASGLAISVTPSGGWLQSSPVIPSLGFPLGTRGQMFWLDERLPTALRPGSRPRTTLSPSLAVHDDGTVLAFGTPGGDQQDQWSLLFFLRHVHARYDLQAAIDAPAFHSEHMPSSFWPRGARPRRLVMEGRYRAETVDALRRMGHDVLLGDDWSLGRISAASAGGAEGWLRAAANPRGMLGYASAW